MAKPIKDQVVVITGASSGIGRAATLAFAEAGATLVLAARNTDALNEVAAQARQKGAQVMVMATDVGDWEQMRALAGTAHTTFGRIDTWVNNAGVGLYATADQTTIVEAHQVMQTNFMGVVYGVSAVLPYMKLQRHGTIINVGSVESKRALPYHSVYSASKHAVKAYTDALRMELDHEKTGVKVTLIMPAGINTPFFNNARSKLGTKPMPAPPAYAPELVAAAIVSAAASPQRDIFVGGAGWFFGLLERISPKLADKLMTTGGMMFKLQRSSQPDNGTDSLFEPNPSEGTGRIHGDFAHITKPSLYTPVAELTPLWVRRLLMVGAPLLLIYSFFVRPNR